MRRASQRGTWLHEMHAVISGRVLVSPTEVVPIPPPPPAQSKACLPTRPPTCSPARLQYCVTVANNGTVEVELSATDEPLLLVPKQWQKSPDFFQLLEHRPVRELMAGRAPSLRRRAASAAGAC